jgi:hypothetical protein
LEQPRPNEHVITPMSYCCLGYDLAGMVAANFVSTTYPTTNLCIAVPFEIAGSFLVRKVFWFNGTTAGTNSVDVGVYEESGKLIVSGGGTLSSGASATQEVDVADTQLKAGRYWLAYSQNGTTATPMMSTNAAGLTRAMGVAQMATAYPLPATFVPAVHVNGNIPLMGISSRVLAS